MSNPIEKWQAVKGYEGLYEVSSYGRVRSLPREVHHGNLRMRLSGKILKPCKSANGYYYATLSRGGKRKQMKELVHTLVLKAFVGPRPIGMECCHYPDKARTNNHLENLRWDTSSANHQDAIKHGYTYRHAAKLTDAQVRRIRKLLANRAEKGLLRKLAKQFGVGLSAIYAIKSKRTWRHLDAT